MNTRERPVKPRQIVTWLLVAAVVGFIALKLHGAHFDWAGFLASFRTANLGMLALATLVIYGNNPIRALRWAIFLKPAWREAGLAPVPSWKLVGSQFIGFAGLAIFGRIGELIRPLLVARRTGLSFSSQVAVVTVERVFDLGAFALLFSLNLLLSPDLQTLPYHERFHMVGYAIAGLTVVLALFVVAVRVAGGAVAGLMARLVGLVSKAAGESVREKVLAFRAGLNVIESRGDFALVTVLSIVLWAVIALSYFLILKAFPAPVHDLTFAHTLVMMGFSVVGSIVQLPGVGGGAQVGTISALTLLFGIPKELAVSAGLMLWLITTMAIIPPGLLYAKLEGVSLGQVARRSEEAEDAASK